MNLEPGDPRAAPGRLPRDRLGDPAHLAGGPRRGRARRRLLGRDAAAARRRGREPGRTGRARPGRGDGRASPTARCGSRSGFRWRPASAAAAATRRRPCACSTVSGARDSARARLAPIAATLGSDVPLFLGGGLSLIRGRGEIVERAAAGPDVRPAADLPRRRARRQDARAVRRPDPADFGDGVDDARAPRLAAVRPLDRRCAAGQQRSTRRPSGSTRASPSFGPSLPACSVGRSTSPGPARPCSRCSTGPRTPGQPHGTVAGLGLSTLRPSSRSTADPRHRSGDSTR